MLKVPSDKNTFIQHLKTSKKVASLISLIMRETTPLQIALMMKLNLLGTEVELVWYRLWIH